MMRRHLGCIVVALLAALLLPALAAAQNSSTFTTADLAGRWFLSQVVTPTGTFTGNDIRGYSGNLNFAVTGTLAPGGDPLDNNLVDGETDFDVSGTLTVSAQGLLTGTLTLVETFAGGETRTLVVREARLLVNRHTVVGAARVARNGGAAVDTGLFTMVRRTAQAFTFEDDLDGNWRYHEINPTNEARGEQADWTRGTITFHADGGCTEADLFFSDGSVRAQRDPADPTSFG
jgi:hypothetical protein